MYSPGSSRDSPYYYDDDYDDHYDYDYGSFFGDFPHPVGRVQRESSGSSLELEKLLEEEQPAKKLLSLKELCCRFVGQNFPFGRVQLHPSRVPEDVQRRIAFWSFPIEEKKLLDYATVMGGAIKDDVERARRTKVDNMIQSGMYLTGNVSCSPTASHFIRRHHLEEKLGKSFRAYVQFDRGCITTTKCSCGEQNWCRHVLALCLARVNESAPLQLHPPISETLTNLDREQLQKLVQYFLEKLPLEGVAAVQEVASSLLDKGSEINQTPGAPDLTAGGCPGDKPVWQMDTKVVIQRLNSAYEMKLDRRYRGYYDASPSFLQHCTAALVGFKEFTSDATPNAPSDLLTLLLYEDDNLSVALKWALEKLSKEISKEVYQHTYSSHVYSSHDVMTKEPKWVEWCFCRMLLPVMQMFFVSPAISSSVKEDVTECLSQCLQQDLPSPIMELFNCFKQVATNRVSADTNGCHQLLSRLQQTLSSNIHQVSNIGGLAVNDPALLHCAMANVQYMDFYDHVCASETEDIIFLICTLLFPAILADAASLEELVAIRVDDGLQGISLPLLLEYGTTLLHCTSTPDLAAELVFKLMGNQLTVSNCSTEVLVHRTWAAKAMIATVDGAETFTKACHAVKSKLADLSIKWLQQTCRALESCPNPTTTLTGMWNMMRLVCRCGTADCLKVVRQMTQELIGLLSSALLNISLTTETDSSHSKDSNLPVEVMADSFTGLLVDLFTMLPVGESQELFTTLYNVYPKPVDFKRSLELVQYEYGDWRQRLLHEATALVQPHSTTFFPREQPMESFKRELAEAHLRYGYDSGYHYRISRPATQSGSERAEVLQACRTQYSVSSRHISFLNQLHKCLQDAGAPLAFQLQLLATQVSNCLDYNWARRAPSYRRGCGHNLDKALMSSKHMGSDLQALKDMWEFAMSPESVLNLLECVQSQTPPQVSDVMCDILMSVLDCKATLYLRIFELIHKISSNPGHILQAVNVASCSVSSRDDKHRTTVIQCAEALGKSYSQFKAVGAAEEMLLMLREKAVELLHQARSIPVVGSTHRQVMLHQLSSKRELDVQSVMKVVRDSGQQALADLLALIEMLPGEQLLQSLEEMTELCNFYFKDTPGGQSMSLQASPFKEAVASLLEKRKNEIKILAGSHGETGRGRGLVNDLKACFEFVGDETAFTTFEQDLAAILQNANRQGYRRGYRRGYIQMPWGIVYNEDDDEETVQQDALLRLLALNRDQRYFW